MYTQFSSAQGAFTVACKSNPIEILVNSYLLLCGKGHCLKCLWTKIGIFFPFVRKKGNVKNIRHEKCPFPFLPFFMRIDSRRQENIQDINDYTSFLRSRKFDLLPLEKNPLFPSFIFLFEAHLIKESAF